MSPAVLLSSPCLALVPAGWRGWFDADPARYWTVAWMAWTLLSLLVLVSLIREWHPTAAVVRKLPGWIFRPLLFAVVVVLVALAFRWPMVLAGPLDNPDETQMGAGALTYWLDPVPWRSVDLQNAGPLDAYVLWPSRLLTGRIDYPGLRLTALALHLVTALAGYGLLRRVTSEAVARLGALPLIAFVVFTSHWEYVQYSSEQLSVALLALGAYFLAVAATAPPLPGGRRPWSWYGAGACLGCLPFAKLQAVPLGLGVALAGFAAAWWSGAPAGRERLRRLVGLVGGALTPLAVFAAVISVYGLWAQFHASYLEAGSLYTLGYDEARENAVRNFWPMFLEYNHSFRTFACGALASLVAAALFGGIPRLQPRRLLAGVLALLALAAWTAIYPARPFWHYLQFLLPPLGWIAGLSLAAYLAVAQSTVTARGLAPLRWLAVATFAALALVPQVASRAGDRHPVVGQLEAARVRSLHPVSAQLRQLARPGDTLLVWGWFPRLYIETGLPQATRDAHTARAIEPQPMRRFYRDRIMRDLAKHPAAFIVDAVAPGAFTYHDRAEAGPQIFPEFAALVQQHYRLVAEVDGFRIYQRRD
ncbi:MAG: hypothetical protein JSR48_13480 [Verrucomicrobia bacterium]|nr:hypothetical protein [Verrucomicrobiota bacterium]